MDRSLLPNTLVDSLRNDAPGARAALTAFCSAQVTRVIDRLIDRGELDCDRGILVERSLRWVEIYLRSRPPWEFHGLTCERFLAHLLAAVYKMLVPTTAHSEAKLADGSLSQGNEWASRKSARPN